MDYTVDSVQVETNAPSESAVSAYAKAFVNLVEEEVGEDA